MTQTKRAAGRPRSEQAHEAILRATIAEIRAVGYDAAAMDSIAVRAGVGKATLYRRWDSKEALTVAALERVMLAHSVPDTGNARDDLLAVMRDTLRMYHDPATHKLLSALVAAMARSIPIARAARRGFIAARRETIRQVVANGIASTQLRRDTNVELVLDVLSGPLAYRALVTGDAVDETLVHDVVDVVMRAFGNQQRNTRGRRV